MTLLGIENKNAFPKVPYSTALDVYVGVCFAFILSTIVEFAFVHYFTKYGTGEPFLYDSSDDESLYEEVMGLPLVFCSICFRSFII